MNSALRTGVGFVLSSVDVMLKITSKEFVLESVGIGLLLPADRKHTRDDRADEDRSRNRR